MDSSEDRSETARKCVDGILGPYERYRAALLQLFSDLDICNCYASDPQRLVAGLVVAQLVDGVALPPSPDWFQCFAEVLDSDGRRIRVIPVSDLSDGGWILRHDSDDYDLLGIIAFVHAQPVAVHLVPADRIPAVSEHFGHILDTLPGHLSVTMMLHTSMMLEPVKAAAAGVVSYSLLENVALPLGQECEF